MYQKIIELLRIHGYMKNDTETGPCYVKNINGRNKCVFVIFDKNPDGSSILEEDLYHLDKIQTQTFGRPCKAAVWYGLCCVDAYLVAG